MDKQNFIKLIEANLDQLLELSISNGASSPMEKSYLTVLTLYLRGESNELLFHVDKCMNMPLFFSSLIKARYNILVGSINAKVLEDLVILLNQTNLVGSEDMWRGEISFVLGMSFLEIKDYDSAKKYFEMAYRFLCGIGAKKKAVKSLLNLIVAESRLHNHKKLIVDYEFVAKKAIQAGDPIVAGICYLNISREFQLIGSMNLALRYANKSIENLSADLGINHYYSALLHRSHVFIELGRLYEAQMDYEAARVCSFSQIQEALKVIECMLGKQQTIASEKLDPTWKGRFKELEEGKPKLPLTEMETRLIECIAAQAQTKEELIEKLYGDKIDYSSAENRLKVLLSRFRKRHPGLIVSEDNKFKLADEVLNVHKVS